MATFKWKALGMKLEVSKGTIFGAVYYTVHPVPNWDLNADWGNIETWQAMMDWTIDTFGPGPMDGIWTPDARWYANNAKFWFRKEEDRDWFLLRWS